MVNAKTVSDDEIEFEADFEEQLDANIAYRIYGNLVRISALCYLSVPILILILYFTILRPTTFEILSQAGQVEMIKNMYDILIIGGVILLGFPFFGRARQRYSKDGIYFLITDTHLFKYNSITQEKNKFQKGEIFSINFNENSIIIESNESDSITLPCKDKSLILDIHHETHGI